MRGIKRAATDSNAKNDCEVSLKPMMVIIRALISTTNAEISPETLQSDRYISNILNTASEAHEAIII